MFSLPLHPGPSRVSAALWWMGPCMWTPKGPQATHSHATRLSSRDRGCTLPVWENSGPELGADIPKLGGALEATLSQWGTESVDKHLSLPTLETQF